MRYEEIRNNREIRALLKKGNANLRVLGFTDHSTAHCALVAERAADILKALETEDFATVAKQYSEDGSAQDGGILGYFDNNNTTYVDTFKETAKTVSEGEMSDVFVSEYGYHIIYCNTENLDELYVYTDFLNAMFEAYPNLYNLPLVEKAKELGIEFTDVELYNTLVEAMGVESEDVQ